MGGFASTHRGHANKSAPSAAAASGSGSQLPQSGASTPAADDVKMDDVGEVSESHDSLGEAQLGSLRVKDPEAWKGNNSPRPRSALKHGSSTASYADSEGSGGMVERTPSGRRMPRKVSFQVHGLAAPQSVQALEAGGADGDDLHQAHKRVRGSEEFSMKFLVDRFYSKVLTLKELQPFFDGVDMLKLKNQQEALMLLVFGGQELLEDELPGLSADLRLIHLHLLFEGLNLTHWRLFAQTFNETLDDLQQIPEDVKQRAKAYMDTTQQHFRPIEPQEWPPKVVYKGWTKRSCPFHTSIKRPADPSAPDAAAPAADNDDDGDFVLPGINSPPLAAAPTASTTVPPPQAAAAETPQSS